MGFPLRSNLFKVGTDEQRYFAKFPVQVAVLFSPTDSQFKDAFKELFTKLDKLTGDNVAFFAVIDPPDEWVQAAEKREWWRKYQERVGVSGYSLETDLPLAMELTRQFNVNWDELPALVISTNLWNAEFAIVSTSAFYLEKQMSTINSVVEQWGEPTLDHVLFALEEKMGDTFRYYSASQQLRFRLTRIYDVLDSFNARLKDRYQLDKRYWGLIRGEINTSMAILRSMRTQGENVQQNNRITDDDNSLILREAAGYLVAPATVAEKAKRITVERVAEDLVQQLEEESKIEVDTAFLNAQFLHELVEKRLRDVAQIDFSAGVAGIWKALELEINHSLIQAARKSRSIKMPEFYTLYVNNFPKEKSQVQTGTRGKNPVKKDLNGEDKTHKTSRHKFLTLGEAWHVTNSLSNSPVEMFDKVLSDCGVTLSKEYFDDWKLVNGKRNIGSHLSPLNYRDYRLTLTTAFPRLFEPLIKVKKAMKLWK